MSDADYNSEREEEKEESDLPTESVEELVKKANDLKQQGNMELGKGKLMRQHTAGKNALQEACMCYARGLQSLGEAREVLESQSSIELDEEETAHANDTTLAEMAQLQLSLYLNLAAVNLLMEEWNPAAACCTEVLEKGGEGIAKGYSMARVCGRDDPLPLDTLKPEDISYVCKALYRRSQAYVGRGDHYLAKGDLYHALKLQPKDPALREHMKKVKHIIAEHENKETLRRETEEGKQRLLKSKSLEGASPVVNQTSTSTSGATLGANSVTSLPRKGEGPGTRIAVTVTSEKVLGTETSAESSAEGSKEKSEEGSAGTSKEKIGSDVTKTITASTADVHIEDINTENIHVTTNNDKSVDISKNIKVEAEDMANMSMNGGVAKDGSYTWSQSLYEVRLYVPLPPGVKTSDIKVTFKRLYIDVHIQNTGDIHAVNVHNTSECDSCEPKTKDSEPKTKDSEPKVKDSGSILIRGTVARPIDVGECLWMLESPQLLVLYICKQLESEGENGHEWWDRVFEGDAPIDTSTLNAGTDMRKYPEHVRRKAAKTLWERRNRTPEQVKNDEMIEAAKAQWEQDAVHKEEEMKTALKDPAKAEMYRQLKESYPDIPIHMR